MIKVGMQGEHGTFSEMAVRKYFAKNENTKAIGYPDFISIMEDVEKGVLDYAVLPVENSTTGIIARTYDLFREYAVYAIGEVYIAIREQLISVKEAKLSDIREVYSHPEALSQCQNFFQAYPHIKQIPFQDTAKSVAYIKEENSVHKAALGSVLAAEYYDGKILVRDVNDTLSNTTRFLVITHQKKVDAKANKMSLMFIAKHEVGSLNKILQIFAEYELNMLKIESRPVKERVFEYLFYVDIEANENEERVKQALSKVKTLCADLQIFGCYEKGVL